MCKDKKYDNTYVSPYFSSMPFFQFFRLNLSAADLFFVICCAGIYIK